MKTIVLSFRVNISTSILSRIPHHPSYQRFFSKPGHVPSVLSCKEHFIFTQIQHKFYFTNTDTMKKDDPYATLGLQWGATIAEIKDAYKTLARELHPDVNKKDSPEKAVEKFKLVQLAYQKLMNVEGNHRDDLADEWAFKVWRGGDMIAQKRTDVAGVARKRPVKPADSKKRQWGIASLGHPDGRGNASIRSEYLADGGGKKTGTVGSGRNKWVEPKVFKPWDPNSIKFKKATGSREDDEN